MNCFETKQKMSNYMDMELPDKEMQKLAEHLKNCPDCQTEYNTLKRLDAIFAKTHFAQPTIAYWQALPKTITARLGLETSKSKRLFIWQAMEELKLAFGFKWGLAGALALAATIFFLRGGFFSTPQSPITQTESIPKKQLSESQIPKLPTINATDVNSAPAAPSEESELLVATDESSRKEPDKAPTEDSELGLYEPAAEGEETASAFAVKVARQTPSRLPVRIKIPSLPRFTDEIYPIPNSDLGLWQTLPVVEEKLDQSAPERRTYALESKVNSQSAAKSEAEKQVDRAASSFSETLWIVQESRTLSEKRNIWLSYISREQDVTYRSLGVYHLALVLAKIVEQTKDADKAREALEFFKEHEKSLRFQLSDPRFNIKMNIFEKIINQ